MEVVPNKGWSHFILTHHPNKQLFAGQFTVISSLRMITFSVYFQLEGIATPNASPGFLFVLD